MWKTIALVLGIAFAFLWLTIEPMSNNLMNLFWNTNSRRAMDHKQVVTHVTIMTLPTTFFSKNLVNLLSLPHL